MSYEEQTNPTEVEPEAGAVVEADGYEAGGAEEGAESDE